MASRRMTIRLAGSGELLFSPSASGQFFAAMSKSRRRPDRSRQPAVVRHSCGVLLTGITAGDSLVHAERVMDFFVLATIILGIWAALGPLVGVHYGNVLSRRLQREHWVAENKKQEYREVLSAMTEAFATIVRYGSIGIAIGPEEQRTRDRAERQSLEVLRDRLFIANELGELKALNRWVEALRDFDNQRNITQFTERFSKLSSDIREVALRSMGND